MSRRAGSEGSSRIPQPLTGRVVELDEAQVSGIQQHDAVGRLADDGAESLPRLQGLLVGAGR